MIKCRLCDLPATRVAVYYSMDMKHLSFWSRLFRKARRGKFHTEPMCEKHRLMCSEGIDTIRCDNCLNNSLIDMDLLYDEHYSKFYCTCCGEELTFESEESESVKD